MVRSLPLEWSLLRGSTQAGSSLAHKGWSYVVTNTLAYDATKLITAEKTFEKTFYCFNLLTIIQKLGHLINANIF